MAGRRQVGALHHPRDLVPEQRDVARIAVVRGRGEQAEEAVLADHLALGVEPPDPDVVQIDRAVHGRARVRLGDHQRRRIARPAPDLRRQRGEAARGRARRTLPAQQAERGALDPAQLIAALVADQVVAAVAEEGEVVVGDPRQERLRLLQVRGIDRPGAVPEIGERRVDLAEHRPPVLDRGAHVAERALELGADPVQPLQIALPVDLDVHERFERGFAAVAGGRIQHRLEHAVCVTAHRQHRMDREVDQEAQAVQRHAHRIDQERHVVGDHLDDGMGRLPAVLLDLRIVDPHLGVPRLGAARRSAGARARRHTDPRGRDRSGRPAAPRGSSGARTPRRARPEGDPACRAPGRPPARAGRSSCPATWSPWQPPRIGVGPACTTEPASAYSELRRIGGQRCTASLRSDRDRAFRSAILRLS